MCRGLGCPQLSLPWTHIFEERPAGLTQDRASEEEEEAGGGEDEEEAAPAEGDRPGLACRTRSEAAVSQFKRHIWAIWMGRKCFPIPLFPI